MNAVLLLAILPSADAALPQAAVDELSWIVGEWKGVGQVRRGSASGAWRESAIWEFEFAARTEASAATDPTALLMTIDSGQLLETVRIETSADGLVALATRPDSDTAERLARQPSDEDRWVFGGQEGDTLKLSLRRISDIRAVLLVETPRGAAFRRAAEVGYTRAGERLANAGSSGRVCIVTGGRGTMAVEHDGTTYYVCCSGCKQAFEANPEQIIADAKKRAEKAAD